MGWVGYVRGKKLLQIMSARRGFHETSSKVNETDKKKPDDIHSIRLSTKCAIFRTWIDTKSVRSRSIFCVVNFAYNRLFVCMHVKTKTLIVAKSDYKTYCHSSNTAICSFFDCLFHVFSFVRMLVPSIQLEPISSSNNVNHM